MKTVSAVLLAFAGSVPSAFANSGNAVSPVAKVLSMVSELQAKVIGEGEVAQKEYAEFAEWCEDRSSNLGFEIKTGQSQANSLKATIAEEDSRIASLTTKVEELIAELGVDDADLTSATTIRQKELEVFKATDKDLVETVDMLGRASLIIESEMKGGASMMQLRSAQSLEQALSVLAQASLVNSADASKLTAFLQANQQGDAADVGAPAGAVYESQSGDILATLQDLKEKAESQLDAARNKETADTQSFEMLKQSLEDEISYGKKELAEAKKNIAASTEAKAVAEGDLVVTSKDLDEDVKAKSTLHHDCMTKASNFEAATKSRGEELAALAKAKEIINEAMSSSLSQVSLFQMSRIASGADLAGFEAARLVRDLARKDSSSALAQLASRMMTVMHGAAGADQFAKIKGLIRDMIAKLESEADADASEKAWCDRNLADARQRQSEKNSEIAKLTTKIDQMSAKSAQLKAQIATLQEQLAKLAGSQAEMDKLRLEEKQIFANSKAELEKGLEGLKLALKVLTEYYATSGKAHEAADGASNGIISLLEVCESDFTQELARTISDEEAAIAEYEKVTKENQIETATKNQDVKYKTKESKGLDEDSNELSTDRGTAQSELDATQELLSKLEKRCVARAETYAQRKARHAAEIAGLKEALDILENETAFLQSAARRKLRGDRHRVSRV